MPLCSSRRGGGARCRQSAHTRWDGSSGLAAAVKGVEVACAARMSGKGDSRTAPLSWLARVLQDPIDVHCVLGLMSQLSTRQVNLRRIAGSHMQCTCCPFIPLLQLGLVNELVDSPAELSFKHAK